MTTPAKVWEIIRAGEAPAITRAVYHLARARLRLSRITPDTIARLNRQARTTRLAGTPDEAEEVERITRAVARAARLVPWRSDCLVQALGAQEWCSQAGIRTTITIQVGLGDKREFMAHAILKHHGKCVLGQTASTLHDIYAPDEMGDPNTSLETR